MDEFKVYDLKLKDGRYFSNVVISDWSGACYHIDEILNNIWYSDDGKKHIEIMSAWDKQDDDCVNELCTFTSKDIEYIAQAYKNDN